MAEIHYKPEKAGKGRIFPPLPAHALSSRDAQASHLVPHCHQKPLLSHQRLFPFDCRRVLTSHPRMNTSITLYAMALFASTVAISAADTQDTRVFEMRIYHAAPG